MECQQRTGAEGANELEVLCPCFGAFTNPPNLAILAASRTRSRTHLVFLMLPCILLRWPWLDIVPYGDPPRGILLIGNWWSHAQHFAVRPLGRLEAAPFIAILQRMERNGKLVADLDRRSGPASTFQVIGTHSLDSPGLHDALLVRHVYPNPGMRVGPVHLFYRSGDDPYAGHLKCGIGMVG